MTEEILVNVTPQETRVTVMQQGVVQELHVERSSSRGLVGNVYLGRVARVLPGMQSAFIDIGLDRAAFLHVADIWSNRHGAEEAKPIERLLAEGQNILVQVIKDPIGTKGARLSTQVSIAGRFLVYLPQESHIGISQRIEDEVERTQLRERLQQALPGDETGGFIIRTMAEAASIPELASDIDYLRRLWHGIREESVQASAPTPLYHDLNLSLRVLRDFVSDETARVLVDSRETHQKMLAFAAAYTRKFSERIEHYSGERPLFDLYGVEDEIERALARRVDLKSGGYLIIDQTEALTTVDVNTGGYVGGRNFDDTIFKTNLEAAQVIARQLRLRNLGGIIIIDFIDMDNEEHRSLRALGVQEGAGPGPHAHVGERLHRARAGGDDAQAHPREPRPRAVRGVSDLPGARGGEDRADGVLRDPARDRARGPPVQRPRIPHRGGADRDRSLSRRGVAESRDAGRFRRQAHLAAGGESVLSRAVRRYPDLIGRASRGRLGGFRPHGPPRPFPRGS